MQNIDLHSSFLRNLLDDAQVKWIFRKDMEFGKQTQLESQVKLIPDVVVKRNPRIMAGKWVQEANSPS